jgi:hypothetical protein
VWGRGVREGKRSEKVVGDAKGLESRKVAHRLREERQLVVFQLDLLERLPPPPPTHTDYPPSTLTPKIDYSSETKTGYPSNTQRLPTNTGTTATPVLDR